MKTKLMAAVAAIAVMTATGAARAQTADSTEIKTLKAQSDALKKQNQALEQRLNKLEQQQQQAAAKPAPSSFMAADLPFLKGGPAQCAPLTLDGPLTFCGITIFGTLDAGLGWASYGLPSNGKLYLGDNLINKNATHSYFGVSPSNLSQTTVGIKGATELLPGLTGLFYASTGINPQSGQLANAPGSLVDQNGLNRNAYSNNGDGSRGGQAFNDQLYVGLANPIYGQLTFGRHKNLTNDMVGAYDPAGGSYAFSVIGYSGTPVAGLGDTGNSRWDDSFKYRLDSTVRLTSAPSTNSPTAMAAATIRARWLLPRTPSQTCYAAHERRRPGRRSASATPASISTASSATIHQAVSNGILSSTQAFGLGPAANSTFTPNVRRGRHLDRREHQHPGRHDFGQHRLGARRQIYVQPVEILRRLVARDLPQPARITSASAPRATRAAMS